MPTRKLSRDEWTTTLAQYVVTGPVKEVQIEAIGPAIGDQLDLKWTSVAGLIYDPSADEIKLGTPMQGRVILNPEEIYVEEGIDGIEAMEVIDASKTKYVLSFRNAPALGSTIAPR